MSVGRNLLKIEEEKSDFPPHDLEAQSSLTIQLRTPLIAGETSDRIALRILQSMNDKTDAINWKDYKESSISSIALLACVASASTCKSFSDHIIHGFFPDLTDNVQTITSWCIAVPAILAQFSFTINSNLTLAIKFKREISHANQAEVRAQLKPILKSLIIVLPTVFSGVIMTKKSFTNLPPAVMITLYCLRAIAAFGTNMDYYLQKQKNVSGWKSIPSIALILEAQQYLNTLAKHNGTEYIKKLSHNGLINAICRPDLTDAKQAFDYIFTGLLDILPPNFQRKPLNKPSKVIKYLSLGFGGITSLMNLTAAAETPGLFSMKVPENFSQVFTDFDWDLMPGFLVGILVFGLLSAYVNTAINSTSCARLFTSILRVKNNISEKGLKQYLASFSVLEWINAIFGLVIFSLAYGLSNGGSAYCFPIVEELKIPLGIFAVIVFTAIGFMSFDSSGNNLKNVYYRELFLDFLSADNKELYFTNLTDAQKQQLVILLHTYSNIKLESMLEDLNNLEADTACQLLTEPANTLVKNHFEKSLTPLPTDAPIFAFPNPSLPSQAGLFGRPHAASINQPPHSSCQRIPRVISTNKLNPPPSMREQISPVFLAHSMPDISSSIDTVVLPISQTPPPRNAL